ncbi:MAG: hypothetical protein KDA51_14700, partial [Planctomycetales bacterium]|nr:hypothetical protein [Planctomycetales bacterium]
MLMSECLICQGFSAETATARYLEYSLELPVEYVRGNGPGEVGPQGMMWKHSVDTDASPGVKLTVMPRIRYLRGADAGYDALLPVGELSIAELRKGSKPFTFESREVKIQGEPAVMTS